MRQDRGDGGRVALGRLDALGGGAVAQSEVTGRIEGLSVGDVMDRTPVAIPERTTVEPTERGATTIASILAHDGGSMTIRDDAPLESVLGNQALRRLGALMAVDGEGRLSGVVTVGQVGRALQG